MSAITSNLPRSPPTNSHAVTLNRLKTLNALSTPLINELNTALLEFESHPEIRSIILTGSERTFSVGSDIKEIAPLTSQVYTTSFIEPWSKLTTALAKPLIAAVSGHALGR